MNKNGNIGSLLKKQKITVEARNVDGIVDASGLDRVDAWSPEHSDDLTRVLEPLGAIPDGLRTATEQDSRGRSRKTVRQSADRDDLSSEDVGHVLRVFKAHDPVVRDGNRWRVAEAG